MINRGINYIPGLIILLSCIGFNAGAQNTQAIAKLDLKSIRIGDQVKLHLSVEQPVNELITFPVLGDSLSGKVLVLSSSKMDTIRDQNDHNRITVTKSIMITSFDEGTYTIPPFVFKAKEGELKSNELSLMVSSVKVDTTKAIYDIKQPLAVSYSWIDWVKDNWPWLLFGVLGLILIAGLIYYLKKRPKKQIVKPVVVKPSLPVHTLALNKLKELRDKKLWQKDEVKQYYSELSDVMREYLEKRFQIKTYEKTTDEIFFGIKQLDIENDNKEMVHQLLITADLVKFAKEKPLSADNEMNIDNAMMFVLKTQQTDTQENIGGTEREHH